MRELGLGGKKRFREMFQRHSGDTLPCLPFTIMPLLKLKRNQKKIMISFDRKNMDIKRLTSNSGIQKLNKAHTDMSTNRDSTKHWGILIEVCLLSMTGNIVYVIVTWLSWLLRSSTCGLNRSIYSR